MSAFDAVSVSPLGSPWWTLEHTRTWDHVATGTELMVVMVVLVRRTEAVDPIVEAAYADQALTSKGRVWVNNLPPSQRTHSFIEVFTGVVEEAGTYEASVTVSSGTRFSGEYRAACLTYSGVSAAGQLTTGYGNAKGAGMGFTVASKTGRAVVSAFTHESYSNVTGYAGTSRNTLNLSVTLGRGVVGDHAGSASVQVGATRQSNKPWCGVALDLIDAAEGDTITGSTPVVEVETPVRPSTKTIPVLTLAPAINQMNPKHFRGELFRAPYVPEKVSYMNIPGNVFAAGGVKALDKALHKYVGKRVLVVGHSQGGQVIYKWLREKGPTSDIDPSDVTFIVTGNPERKYGGIPGGGDYPGGPGGTGVPEDTPYRVFDYARQYDFWCDHPDDTDNTYAMRNVDPKGSNLGWGSPVHTDYSKVVVNPNDPRNFTLTEGNITYVWSPTYPAPLIDDQDFFQTAQAVERREGAVRDLIEAGYDRPVDIPPPPPDGGISDEFPWGWDGSKWVRVPREIPPAPTTWWME